MTNLLRETVEEIADSGHTTGDIIFIGSMVSGYCCTWDEFCVLANRDYDGGFGGQEVASDLIIVFSDLSIMERHEYDGSECWCYQPRFLMPKERIAIKSLFCEDSEYGCWSNLKEINENLQGAGQ